MAVRKKDGGTNWKYYEALDTIELFDPVRLHLIKNYKKYVQADPPTNKSLATLTGQLVQFQEEAFGKNVSKPALTRLPMKQFLDYSSGGSLCHIIGACYKFKVDQGWRRFDFQSPSRMDRNVELCLTIEKTLREGTLVDSKEKATHIIHPAPSLTAEEEWLRPLVKRDKQVLVHWWYHPDSYDSWVPISEVSQEPEPTPERSKPWELHARWLSDLDLFNEWMNEEDYEIETPDCFICRVSGKTRRKCLKGKPNAEEVNNDEKKKELRKRKASPSPSPEQGKRKKKGPKKKDDEKPERDEDHDDATNELPEPEAVPNVSVPKYCFHNPL
eukprot:gene14214-5224_t